MVDVKHKDFYADTLQQLMQRGLLTTDMSVLVVCAGVRDRDVFRALGFRNVTISNLDTQQGAKDSAPFEWACVDAEAIDQPDDSYDWVVAHSGLHHCYSPHQGLLEMYRVARRGVLVFEPRDSMLVRLGVRLNFGQDYEVAAVVLNGLNAGGVRNSGIPNYVYRWSEREIEKTLRSYAPTAPPKIHYFYALRVPQERLDAMRNRLVATSVKLLLPLIRLVTMLFPKQCNNFAFVVEKARPQSEMHPWLRLKDGKIGMDEAWVARHYRGTTVEKTSS
jgi:SAM-dependent methyltransferase